MKAEYLILVVDDEANQRDTLARILQDQDYVVSKAQNVLEATELIKEKAFDLVLTDFRMPGGSGIDVATKALELNPKTSVMIMTAYADVESVIAAMRAGVADYLLKPLNVDSLLKKIEVLKENQDLKSEIGLLRTEINRPQNENRLIGLSPGIVQVRQLIQQVGQSKGTVLITGESGTGKEVAARLIHAASPQREKRFVAINCGAIPENLLESELFGHKKGSFTGAVGDKEGLFVTANGGTVFLDEIGDMPKLLQVKILRVLQEREVIPVGGTQNLKVEVRVIAATNRDLKADVDSGVFRQDLYYRINVVEIRMPPLRTRPEDIPELSRAIIKKYSSEMGKNIHGISHEAMQRLLKYTWPGNVRELENVIERAMILNQNSQIIEVSDLPAGFQNLSEDVDAGFNLDEAIKRFSRSHIVNVLEASGGDKKGASKMLGLGLSSLYRKLEELGISTKKESLP